MAATTTNDLKRGMTLDLPRGCSTSSSSSTSSPEGRPSCAPRCATPAPAVSSTRPSGPTSASSRRSSKKEMQFLYHDGDHYVFMDSNTSEHPHGAARPGRRPGNIVDGSTMVLQFYKDEIITDLPAAVELTVSDTEPGIQGDRGRAPASRHAGDGPWCRCCSSTPANGSRSIRAAPNTSRGRNRHERAPADRGGEPGGRERALELLYEAEAKDVAIRSCSTSCPSFPMSWRSSWSAAWTNTAGASTSCSTAGRSQVVAVPAGGRRPVDPAHRCLRAAGGAERSAALVINEAVVLAPVRHRRLPRFVNGVLSSVATEVRLE